MMLLLHTSTKVIFSKSHIIGMQQLENILHSHIVLADAGQTGERRSLQS